MMKKKREIIIKTASKRKRVDENNAKNGNKSNSPKNKKKKKKETRSDSSFETISSEKQPTAEANNKWFNGELQSMRNVIRILDVFFHFVFAFVVGEFECAP